jgi:hypothetical protein
MKFHYELIVKNTFLCFAVVNLFAGCVNSAASFNPFVFCSDVVPTNGTSFKVCATAKFTSPSPMMMFPNETITYRGGYSAGYTIVKGLKEGDDGTGNPQALTGIAIDVTRDDDNDCKISVTLKDGKKVYCKSCNYCGNESDKADCTNLKDGRSFNICEMAGPNEGNVFFPLFRKALSAMTPLVQAPVRVPLNAPLKTPRQAPARGKSPVLAPMKARVNAPVLKTPVKAPVAKK